MQDVVAFAIGREEKARDFYRACADNAKKEGIRDFFSEMAEEEERHRKLLADLDISAEKPFSDLDEHGNIKDLRLSDFMIDVKFSPDITYQQALAMAMKKEEKAHKFYEVWKSRCASEKSEKLFSFLAEEELKHKRRLEEIYDSEILQEG
jgi:rubrerythrin